MSDSYLSTLFFILTLIAFHPIAIILMCLIWIPYAWVIIALNLLPYVLVAYKVEKERLNREHENITETKTARPMEVVLKEYLVLITPKHKRIEH